MFFETLSVIVQVISYKFTGKRIFQMAPLHHHFEKKGWAESTIVIRFLDNSSRACSYRFSNIKNSLIKRLIKTLNNKHVYIFGLGESGLSAAKYFYKRGVNYYAWGR